ncbi:hypothetical protein TYRP_006872 [Tyrophagus putrescentiae]|nr:hypothetical protein TYRP_006872 [Tyrophagus putrescentiae]
MCKLSKCCKGCSDCCDEECGCGGDCSCKDGCGSCGDACGCGEGCGDACGCGDCACCSSLFFCLSYSHLIAVVRALFLLLHTLLVATSIFGLIWANVYFNDFDGALTGGFIGGHLATLSAGGLLFGLSGLYAAIKHHRRLLYTHCAVSWTAVLLRGFTWLLAMLHEYRLAPFMYALLPVELLLATLSSLLLRDACIYF